MTFSLQSEIQMAQATLQLSLPSFQELSAYQSQLIYMHIEQRFVNGTGYTWWWEHWKHRAVCVKFKQDTLEQIAAVIPPPHEQMYVVFPTDPRPLAYEGSLSEIMSILGEVQVLDEFCLVGPAGDWLVYENHHGQCSFVGLRAMRYLKEYTYQYPQAIANMSVFPRAKSSFTS